MTNKEGVAKANKKENAKQIMLAILYAFSEKKEGWWSRLDSWKLANLRTELETLFKEADHKVARFSKTSKPRADDGDDLESL